MNHTINLQNNEKVLTSSYFSNRIYDKDNANGKGV